MVRTAAPGIPASYPPARPCNRRNLTTRRLQLARLEGQDGPGTETVVAPRLIVRGTTAAP